MEEIYERVFISNEMSCRKGNEDLVVVHACKSPCHQRAVGYRGNLGKEHPNYLVLETEYDLFLNIIDPSVPLFMPRLFSSFIAFAETHYDNGKGILIHCNQGESRAPSLALLFLAKSLKNINNESYLLARSDFEKLYSRYNPGKGIQTYFTKNWSVLGTDF